MDSDKVRVITESNKSKEAEKAFQVGDEVLARWTDSKVSSFFSMMFSILTFTPTLLTPTLVLPGEDHKDSGRQLPRLLQRRLPKEGEAGDGGEDAGGL